ncbi:Uncharacterised protein [Neisseria meningitidis]|nr:Uncharacterised protein [Neisseria meningitidis]CWP88447.1 Uncharacterised protein [Neisseria meningitidis]CWQ01389.1 Uncharacterised protein [Neisseria meningitidis]CWR26969.1 Uncharacterised protein [Neisseria meningitidis]CWR58565.1 Uncharacterised protein [Neisseria meningitidis]
MSLFFGGREEKYAGIAFNLIPKTLNQIADAADFRAARAQGDEEGEAETDAEVDQADGEDAENAEYERAQTDVAADGGIAEVGGGKGDVADVQRQPEEVSEIAGHTQEHPEDEVAYQRAVVFVDVGGEDAAGPGAHDFTQQGVEGQALAQVEVVGAVVEKTCDDAGAEQPQTCNGGIPQRRVSDDVYGFELVGGGVGIEYGQPVQMGIAERYGARQKDGDGNVAEDGDTLGAAYVDEELGEFVVHRFAAFVEIDLFGKAGGSHRGLLGGDGAVQHMDDHKADAVVEPSRQGSQEGAEAECADADFEQRHQGDDDAAACRRVEHFEIFFAVAGDVVFAVVAFVFGNAAGEHTDAAAAQVAGAVLFDRRVDEGVHQRDGQAVAVAGTGLDVGEQL